VPETSLPHCEIVLASASPRRRELLDQIGIHYHVLVTDVNEAMHAGETVLAHVQRLALAKSAAGRARMASSGFDKPVLGADTVVEIDGSVLGKPGDSAQAMQMLARLSGITHRVHTAVAVVAAQGEFVDVNTSEVEFMKLDQSQIERYIATGEPMDKAGAYAIQGVAAQFVRCLRGSFSSVMGLPLYETALLLARCGVATLHAPSLSWRQS
jgi:septum formation protein